MDQMDQMDQMTQFSNSPAPLLLITEISGVFWAFQFADFHIPISGIEMLRRSPGVYSQIFQFVCTEVEDIQTEAFNLHKCFVEHILSLLC